MFADLYALLGVTKSATQAEIKRAYHKSARVHHPDRNSSPDAAAKFHEIKTAYDVLSNVQRRRSYDATGLLKNFEQYDTSFDLGDFLGREPFLAKDGRDIRVRLDLTFEEYLHGTEREVEVDVEVECSACNHSGGTEPMRCPNCRGVGSVRPQYQGSGSLCARCHGKGTIPKQPCAECQGRTYVTRKKKYIVAVPKGMLSGHGLTLEKRGERGINGGKKGDLIITTKVGRSSEFQPHGWNEGDLRTQVYVTISEALLGCVVEIQDPYGKPLSWIFPPGLESKQLFRVGMGAPKLKGDYGDLYADIIVKEPSGIGAVEREALLLYVELTDDRSDKGK